MRTLRKNQKVMWYATYTGKTMRYDQDGHATGEYDLSYSDPIELRANVSAGSGSIHTQMWGTNWSFDRVCIFEDADIPLTTESVLWIDRKPSEGSYDYKVKRISRSLNSCTVGVTKVSTS